MAGRFSFRVRIGVMIFVIVYAGVLLRNFAFEIMRLMYWPVSQLGPALANTILQATVQTVPLTVVIVLVITWILRPLAVTVRALKSGDDVDAAVILRAQRRLRSITPLLIAGNLIGFGIGSVTTFLASGSLGSFSADLVLVVAGFVPAGLLVMVQIALTDLILAEPRRLLEMTEIDRSRGDRIHSQVSRQIWVAVCAVLYVITFVMSTGLEINVFNARYSQLLARVANREITYQEASDARYADLMNERFHLPATRSDFDIADYYVTPGRAGWVYLAALLYSVGFAAVAQLIISKSDANQLRLITTAIRNMVDGNNEHGELIQITQFDDVGVMSDLLNRLLGKQQRTLRSIAQVSTRVTHASDGLQEVIGTASASTEQMIASVEQVSTNVQSRADQVRAASESLDTVVRSIASVADSVESQSRFVEDTSSALNQLSASIESVSTSTKTADSVATRLEQVAQQGGGAVREAVEAIREIEHASTAAGEIVTVISKISAQTNLLAMNAAIEAAHAGEAGRGFAVVAEEVRGLASTSSTSAAKIADLIKTMVQQVQRGVTLADEAGAALDRIQADVDSTSTLIAEIAHSMQEQTAGTHQVLQSMGSLVSTSSQIKQQVGEQRTQNDRMKATTEAIVTAFDEIKLATEEQTVSNRGILEAIQQLQTVAAENATIVEELGRVVGA